MNNNEEYLPPIEDMDEQKPNFESVSRFVDSLPKLKNCPEPGESRFRYRMNRIRAAVCAWFWMLVAPTYSFELPLERWPTRWLRVKCQFGNLWIPMAASEVSIRELEFALARKNAEIAQLRNLINSKPDGK